MLSHSIQVFELFGVEGDVSGDGDVGIEFRLGDADLALCAAASRSARRISGRRVSRSAGIPTTISGGTAGIAFGPFRGPARCWGGRPRRMHRPVSAFRCPSSRAGISDRVAARADFAWRRSSSLTTPWLKRCWMMRRVCSCRLHVLASQGKPFFGGAELEIGGCHFGLNHDENVVVVLDLARRGWRRPTRCRGESGPRCRVPRRRRSRDPIVEDLADREFPKGKGIVAHLIACVTAEHLLLLREQISGCDTPLGPGFDDPLAGDLEREVLLVGRVHQLVEHGVLKHGPPVAVVGPLADDTLVCRHRATRRRPVRRVCSSWAPP